MYYTWMDIEWKLNAVKENWPRIWESVDVYPDELVIYYNKEADEYFEQSSEFLDKVFNDLWDSGTKIINLQITKNQLAVVFEATDEETIKRPLPLFKNALFQEPLVSKLNLGRLPVPVVAFYSYKGGVGRTLSLISLIREISKDKDRKALIVDADLEAPGLTIMAKSQGFPSERRISYSDVLSIIHNSDDESLFAGIASGIAGAMKGASINIPANGVYREHFFLPAYRFDYQQLDNFVHPENIVSMRDRAFIISEFLSNLGGRLGADAVLVDLRAGLSELSAPFLFDPRVQRVFVTTTSKQSMEGAQFVLDTIQRSSFSKDSVGYEKNDPDITVLLTMIPRTMDNESRQNLQTRLLESFYNNGLDVDNDEDIKTALSDIVICSEFSDNLIHLEDLEQIDRLLKDSSVAQSSVELNKRLFTSGQYESREPAEITEAFRREVVEKIHDIVAKEVTAEGTSGVQIMATRSLKQLAMDYQNTLPRLVIQGAKGSGKTYLYKQLAKNLYWENFTASILNSGERAAPQTLVMPVLASANRASIDPLLEGCFSNLSGELNMNITKAILSDNETILAQKNEENAMPPSEWLAVWNDIFLNSLFGDGRRHSFSEADQLLAAAGKKLLFVLDGLEDIFNQTISSENSQAAVKYLIQDFIKTISTCKNIGILIFIRNDIVKKSISINLDQFESQYLDYALKWTQDEALRLVVWILAQAHFNGYDGMVKEIPRMTHDTLVETLFPFWGRKLGKDTSNEAFSYRWIIAALSDFTLQIQARDIIRFLEFATSDPIKDTSYHDRILLPQEIKKAIVPCSTKKLEEISIEMKNLKPIFDKLYNPGENKKKEIPVKAEDLILNADERSLLEAQGFLKLVDENYYIPEIIRRALGYHYSRAARPKVLSLVLKQ